MSNAKIQVGIIIGGRSVEHEISLISGLQAYLELDDSKYNSKLIYIDKNNKFYIIEDIARFENCKDNLYEGLDEIIFINSQNQLYFAKVKKIKKLYPIDIVIPVVHGYGVEDGTLAGYLEMMNAIYSSSKVIPASIIQDKVATKALLEKYKLPTLGYKVFFENLDINIDNMSYPAIVKPASLGSSIGIKIAHNKEELLECVQDGFNYADKVMVEKALTNFLEYNCALVKDHDEYLVSDIEEVKHEKDLLTFYEKYESSENNRIIPAVLDSIVEEKIKNLTKEIYIKLGLSGVIRVDYLYDVDKCKLYINEINSIPGSLAYYLFESQGLTFKELLNILIQNAVIEKYKNNNKITSYNTKINLNKINKLKK